MSIPWQELRTVVELLQKLMSNAIESGSEGDEYAGDLIGLSFDLTAKHIEIMADRGVDLLDDAQLFTYVSGYRQAMVVAHSVLHAYDFSTENLEPEDECSAFVYGMVANLLPLMQLLPLHLILDVEV